MQVSTWGAETRRPPSQGAGRGASPRPRHELTVVAASRTEIVVEKRDRRAEFLKAMERFRWPAPEGYPLDRDEGNEISAA